MSRAVSDHRADRRIVVVGLGYVGLPLALFFAQSGCTVLGIDIDRDRVARLARGESVIDDVCSEALAAMISAGRLSFAVAGVDTTDYDAYFVCVPTPIHEDKSPDLRAVLSAAKTVAAGLTAQQLVVLQSTTFPGTTTGPFAEVLETSGLRAGLDFDLAFAPERINPGDPASAGRAVPRLVGGSTPRATQRAASIFRLINDDVIEMSSPAHAEMAKLLENTFRNVNIALVNQVALLCEQMNLDVWEVVGGAATKPFGFMPFSPGPGVGGHCIPVDPHYLAWQARRIGASESLISTAAEINEEMPSHVVRLISRAAAAHRRDLRGLRVGLIGVAFKPNVADVRETPAAHVARLLHDAGAELTYHDPHVETFLDTARAQVRPSLLAELIESSDVLCVLTGHSAIDWDAVYGSGKPIVDTTNTSSGRALTGPVLVLGAGWRNEPLPMPAPAQPVRAGRAVISRLAQQISPARVALDLPEMTRD